MTNEQPEKVKEFWQQRARDTQTVDKAVTQPDIWQRWLELEFMKRFLLPSDRVIDVGCGNGYGTKALSSLVREIVGVDYSEEMIRRARAESGEGEKLRFAVGNVMALRPEPFGLFDAAISCRCLINLNNWTEQQHAIANIASVLKGGGRFIFIEGDKNGRRHLNELREKVGLKAMPPVWHNVDFNAELLLPFLRRFFVIRQQVHFGVYDFIARVAHPLLVSPEEPKYDARINQVAASLALESQEFASLSRVTFLVLEKLETVTLQSGSPPLERSAEC